MKLNLILIVLILLVVSCSKVSFRKLASTEDGSRQISTRIELFQIGEVKISLLSPSKFRELYGSAWRLMDGSDTRSDVDISVFKDLTGLDSIPDARGAFLRMANNGLGASSPNANPDNHALGAFQADSLQGHWHRLVAGGWGFNVSPTDRSWVNNTHAIKEQDSNIYAGNIFSDGKNGEPRIGTETRPKNITVNYYVKVAMCPVEEKNCL